MTTWWDRMRKFRLFWIRNCLVTSAPHTKPAPLGLGATAWSPISPGSDQRKRSSIELNWDRGGVILLTINTTRGIWVFMDTDNWYLLEVGLFSFREFPDVGQSGNVASFSIAHRSTMDDENTSVDDSCIGKLIEYLSIRNTSSMRQCRENK